MSVSVREVHGKSNLANGYRVSPIVWFSDWNGGNSSDEEYEEKIPTDRPTLRMNNETKFEPDEASPLPYSHEIKGMNLFERLKLHNKDAPKKWQERSDVRTWERYDNSFKKHLINAFSSELELNSIQRQQAFRWFMKIDISRGKGRSETNALTICALIVNRDAKEYGEGDKVYHPQQPCEKKDIHFLRVEDALRNRFARVTRSSLTSLYNYHLQGDPPVKHPDKWESYVEQDPITPIRPSHAPEKFNPS